MCNCDMAILAWPDVVMARSCALNCTDMLWYCMAEITYSNACIALRCPECRYSASQLLQQACVHVCRALITY